MGVIEHYYTISKTEGNTNVRPLLDADKYKRKATNKTLSVA